MHARLLLALLGLTLAGCPASNGDANDDDAANDDDVANDDDAANDDDSAGDDDDAANDDDSAGDDDDSAGDDDDATPPPVYSRFALLDTGEYGAILPNGRFRAIADLGTDEEVRHLVWDESADAFLALKNSVFGQDFAPQLVHIDPCTGDVTDGAMLDVFPSTPGPLANRAMDALAIDSDGTVWVAWASTPNSLSDTLVTVDSATGSLTTVATVSGTEDGEVEHLFWHDGVLYGVDNRTVHTIDPTTGAASGASAQPLRQAFAPDPETGGFLAFDSELPSHATGTTPHEFVELDTSLAVTAGLGLAMHEGGFGGAEVTHIGVAALECPADDGLLLDLPLDGSFEDVSGFGYEATPGSGEARPDRHGASAGAWGVDSGAGVLDTFWTPGLSGELTVAGWFSPYAALDASSPRRVLTSHDWGNHQVFYQSGQLRLELYDANHAVTTYDVVTDFVADTWVFFAVTAVAGGDVEIHVDGALALTGAAPPDLDPAAGPMGIGGQVNGSYTFDGFLDDFVIYDRALDSSEIAALYSSTP